MKVNKVAPWEGKLIWVDNPRSGKTQKGREWKSVDFALKYTDEQNNERELAFNAFGEERVNTVLSAQLGTTLRIGWRPDSHEYNGRWYTKLDAYDITVIGQQEQAEPAQSPAPQPSAPAETPKPAEETADDNDLPF